MAKWKAVVYDPTNKSHKPLPEGDTLEGPDKELPPLSGATSQTAPYTDLANRQLRTLPSSEVAAARAAGYKTLTLTSTITLSPAASSSDATDTGVGTQNAYLALLGGPKASFAQAAILRVVVSSSTDAGVDSWGVKSTDVSQSFYKQNALGLFSLNTAVFSSERILQYTLTADITSGIKITSLEGFVQNLERAADQTRFKLFDTSVTLPDTDLFNGFHIQMVGSKSGSLLEAAGNNSPKPPAVTGNISSTSSYSFA